MFGFINDSESAGYSLEDSSSEEVHDINNAIRSLESVKKDAVDMKIVEW